MICHKSSILTIYCPTLLRVHCSDQMPLLHCGECRHNGDDDHRHNGFQKQSFLAKKPSAISLSPQAKYITQKATLPTSEKMRPRAPRNRRAVMRFGRCFILNRWFVATAPKTVPHHRRPSARGGTGTRPAVWS